MNNIKFVVGFCWIFLCSLLLWVYFKNAWMTVTTLGLNAGLYLVYVLLFYKPYRAKSIDILQPSLLLITLQMLFFLFAAGVFWYDNLPFVNLLWALLVFVGVLAIQVWEQTAFLKSVEKPHK